MHVFETSASSEWSILFLRFLMPVMSKEEAVLADKAGLER